MIYTVAEIKTLIPSLESVSDTKITSLLLQAEGDILFFLKKKTLPKQDDDTHYDCVKVVCRMLIESYLSGEKVGEMKSYKQGNISVTYEDKNMQEKDLQNKIKKILAPLIRVQIWS